MGEIQQANTLAELRPMLIDARQRVGDLVRAMKKAIETHTATKTAYERALARAKVRCLAHAWSREEKTPTMLNAMAEIEPEVVTARDKYDLAYAMMTALEKELKAAEEDSLSIKKAMSTIESEMRAFGG